MAQFNTFLVAAALVLVSASALIKVKVPRAKMLQTKKRDILRQRLKAAGGCNANVCFAIDGSGRMPAGAFTAQKNFVLDLISIIAVDEPVELAAMQYADTTYPISGLTVDVEGAVLSINSVKQHGGGSNTRSGIEFCASQLETRKHEANKLILLGDGYTDVGRNAVRRANRFRWQGGDMSVVAAGDAAYVDIFALAGWRKSRVFEVDNFFDVLVLEGVIKKLVASICDVGGKQGFPKMPKPQTAPKPWAMRARARRWAKYCKTHTCTWGPKKN